MGSWRNAFDRGFVLAGGFFCGAERRKKLQRGALFFCRSFLRLCRMFWHRRFFVCCHDRRWGRRRGFVRASAKNLLYVKFFLIVQKRKAAESVFCVCHAVSPSCFVFGRKKTATAKRQLRSCGSGISFHVLRAEPGGILCPEFSPPPFICSALMLL